MTEHGRRKSKEENKDNKITKESHFLDRDYQARRLSNKLSDILSEIKDLTNVIKVCSLVSKPNDVVPVNPAINELSQTLRFISETISTQQSTNTLEQSTNASAEEEASRAKAQLSNIWDTKLDRRKDAYWNYTKKNDIMRLTLSG